jgi:alkyl hydroperoxide reductase subunit AhpC
METTMSIRTIKDTETFSPTATYVPATKLMTATFSVRPSDKEPRHVLSCVIDYSKLSPTELVELAHRSVVIDLQRQWRVLASVKGNTARTVNPFARVDVKSAIVDAARKVATPAARASNALTKMSAKERADLLAALQSMVASDKRGK